MGATVQDNSKTRERSKRKNSVERQRNPHKSPYSKKKGSNSRKPKKMPVSQMQKTRKVDKNTLNEASSIKSINSNGSKFYPKNFKKTMKGDKISNGIKEGHIGEGYLTSYTLVDGKYLIIAFLPSKVRVRKLTSLYRQSEQKWC